MPENRQLKQDIRRTALAQRRALSQVHIDDVNANAAERVHFFLRSLYGKTADHDLSVMSYSSFKNEFPTDNINAFLQDRYSLILPYTDNDMVIHALAIRPDSVFRTSGLGIHEPDPSFCTEADPADIDLVLIPGVAFDRTGARIGFGAGCYDRFIPLLKNNVPLVALAYNCQIADHIPSEEHDIPVDFIITETEIITCRE